MSSIIVKRRVALCVRVSTTRQAEGDEPTPTERLDAARSAREATAGRVRLLDTQSLLGPAAINSDSIAGLATALQGAVQSDDPAFRKAHLRLFVDEAIVGDGEIRMRGPKAALAKATAIGALPPTGVAWCPGWSGGWRPRRDSNPRPQD
jgi:hypothetical protein